MELQITEAFPAARFSLHLILFSRQFFCCLEKKESYMQIWMLKVLACWEKTYLSSKAEKKEVWFCAQLCFHRR